MSYYKRIVVFDLETGGLTAKKHGVTEIAMVAVDAETLEIVGEYSCLIKPYDREYTDQALGMSINMTLEELEEKGKDFDVVMEEVLDFLSENKVGGKKPILAGHNIDKFDMGFLEDMFGKKKRKMSKDINTDITIDTLKWSRLKFIDSPKHNLATACQNVGVVLKDAHRALADTKANANMLIEVLKHLRSDGGLESAKVEKKRVNFEF